MDIYIELNHNTGFYFIAGRDEDGKEYEAVLVDNETGEVLPLNIFNTYQKAKMALKEFKDDIVLLGKTQQEGGEN